ncbi:MAG: hypothetical protein R3B54_15205 [Bdellovibrionota bacterium]
MSTWMRVGSGIVHVTYAVKPLIRVVTSDGGAAFLAATSRMTGAVVPAQVPGFSKVESDRGAETKPEAQQ